MILILLFVSQALFAGEKVVAYNEWPDSPEKDVLNLFPDYRDAALAPGFKGAPSKDVILFIKTVAKRVERPVRDVNLAGLVTMPNIAKFMDGLAKVSVINDPAQLAPVKFASQSFRVNPNRAWCDGALCFEMDFIIDATAKFFMQLSPVPIKDPRIVAQSEVRVLRGEELSARFVAGLQNLSGVNTPPNALLQQNIFWFNHFMEFGKILTWTQADPQDARFTLVTGAALFAVERKWWEFGFKGANLSEVLRGRHLNSTTGARMGFPKLVEKEFAQLTGMLQAQ